MRTHTRVKQHACDTCDKLFYTKQDLERHADTHSGVRRFVCGGCGFRFAREDALKRHMKAKGCGCEE
ncbi:hypothetical protein BC829DRAFT_395792 [Chytridium lagenaria]|nr:hypothetical protein BC829DRAFT_395792 [Chytridium lagenaria]